MDRCRPATAKSGMVTAAVTYAIPAAMAPSWMTCALVHGNRRGRCAITAFKVGRHGGAGGQGATEEGSEGGGGESEPREFGGFYDGHQQRRKAPRVCSCTSLLFLHLSSGSRWQ